MENEIWKIENSKLYEGAKFQCIWSPYLGEGIQGRSSLTQRVRKKKFIDEGGYLSPLEMCSIRLRITALESCSSCQGITACMSYGSIIQRGQDDEVEKRVIRMLVVLRIKGSNTLQRGCKDQMAEVGQSLHHPLPRTRVRLPLDHQHHGGWSNLGCINRLFQIINITHTSLSFYLFQTITFV